MTQGAARLVASHDATRRTLGRWRSGKPPPLRRSSA